jgi:hypothetical protein
MALTPEERLKKIREIRQGTASHKLSDEALSNTARLLDIPDWQALKYVDEHQPEDGKTPLALDYAVATVGSMAMALGLDSDAFTTIRARIATAKAAMLLEAYYEARQKEEQGEKN